MYQIPIEQKKRVSCAITGHRNLPNNFNREKAKSQLRALIEDGIKIFYNGLAIGFDLTTAELLLELKETYPQIRLHGCIPFYGQERYYTAEEAELYRRIVSQCDEVTVLDEAYHRSSYFKRNDYMIEQADVLYAYCTADHGGTAYTLKNFIRKKGEENVVRYE